MNNIEKFPAISEVKLLKNNFSNKLENGSTYSKLIITLIYYRVLLFSSQK